MLAGFVLTIIGVALGIMLAAFVLCALMLNEKVLGWYMNYSRKITDKIISEMFIDKEKEAL